MNASNDFNYRRLQILTNLNHHYDSRVKRAVCGILHTWGSLVRTLGDVGGFMKKNVLIRGPLRMKLGHMLYRVTIKVLIHVITSRGIYKQIR